MARDREGGDKTEFSLRQLRETLLDPKAWFVFAFGVLVTMQSPVLTVSQHARINDDHKANDADQKLSVCLFGYQIDRI